jgi:signal transduction histidine kinase
MLNKLHIRLTVLCTLITGIIMIVMSLFCLYIAESGLTKNEYGRFLTSINVIYSYLKSQTNLTTGWLAQTENNGQLMLYIEDNEIPLRYGSENTTSGRRQLINEVKAAASERNMNLSDAGEAKLVPKQLEFSFRARDNKDYYVSAAYIPKDGGSLGVLAIYSLENYRVEIARQRLLFAGVDIAAIILLGFFAYFFTKRTLRPIEQNRKKQVEFIAAASHELRSPLTVITSSMSAMRKAQPAQAKRFGEIIDSEISRMSRLVNDMLSLASADNQSWSLQLQPADMDLLMLNAYEAFQPLAVDKNIQLSLSLPNESLPRCKCDPQRMEQVLTILIDNALSYTPGGGQVRLFVQHSSHRLEIHVIDNGIGITDQDKEHIFDRFYRVDKSHHSKEHFGLGLCIAYEIVKLHKGTLTVSDTPGGGATFVITLNV